MSDPTETNPVFSPRIGCLHAAVVTLVFLITLAISSAIRQRDPEAAAEVAGRLTLIVGSLGFFASYLYQRGHKLLGSVLVLLLWATIPFLMFVMKGLS